LDYEFIEKNFGEINNIKNEEKEYKENLKIKKNIIEECKMRLREFKLKKGRERLIDTNNLKKDDIKCFKFSNQVDRSKTFSYANE
jgi:hypothetical protein